MIDSPTQNLDGAGSSAPERRLVIVSPDRATRTVAGRDRVLKDLEVDLERLRQMPGYSIARIELKRKSLPRVLLSWLFSLKTIPECFYESPPEADLKGADRVLLIGAGAFGAMPRRALNRIPAIFDADDDYGIRLREWRRTGVGYAAGLLGAAHGRLIQRVLGSPIGYFVNWIEALNARGLNRRVKKTCEFVSYTNPDEAADDQDTDMRVAMPPRFQVRRELVAAEGAPKFFFIGTDRLAQNKLALQQLVALWKTCEFEFPLHVHGDISEPIEAPNVIYQGFVERVEDAFPANGVLLYPAQLGGGLKIKLLESVEWGVPFLTEPTGVHGFGDSAQAFIVREDWESAIRSAHTPSGIAALRSQMSKLQPSLKHRFNSVRDESLNRMFGLPAPGDRT